MEESSSDSDFRIEDHDHDESDDDFSDNSNAKDSDKDDDDDDDDESDSDEESSDGFSDFKASLVENGEGPKKGSSTNIKSVLEAAKKINIKDTVSWGFVNFVG